MEEKHFGTTPQGQPVSLFTLGDAGGFQARITNYGGIVTELHVPDREGRMANVVLGFSTLEPYFDGISYFGAIIGRVAGRLTGGKFALDGQTYQLACNQGSNHLHGGRVGLDQRVWGATRNGDSLSLTYRSPEGEEGYPGNVDLEVIYSLTSNQALKIDFTARTDRATPLSLTNHSYFHLGGEGEHDVLDHQLEIFADTIMPVDAKGATLGRRQSVEGQPGDFRQRATLRARVEDLWSQHGDQYLLADPEGGLPCVARVMEPASGRVMEVFTTQRCLQMYTATHLDGSQVGISGRPYERYAGLCLECQGCPDAPNQPDFPSTILRPGETYRQLIEYRFSTISGPT